MSDPDPKALARALAGLALGATLVGAAVDRWPTNARAPLDAAALARAAEGRAPAEALLLGQGLDPAQADAAAWSLLPGIGPKRAAALAAARPVDAAAVGRVRGIGAGRARRIAGQLRTPAYPR